MNEIKEEFYRLAAPIFIGGLFKSGTTLLRAMIGQHSTIASGLETQWFRLNWEGERDKAFFEHVERLRNFYQLQETVVQQMVLKSSSTEIFVDLLLSHFAVSIGKRRWAEKTPGNILHLDRIYRTWPDAKVIHIIRDPRDIFASLKQAKKWDSIEVFTDLWCEYLGAAEDFKKRSIASKDRYLELRYEVLIRRPAEAMKRVLNFVGEAWDPQTASFQGKEDEFRIVLELTGKASTTLKRLEKPISNERIGIWKDIVTQEEIVDIHRRVEERGLLDLMRRIERESDEAGLEEDCQDF